ncbi:MAG: hypothetical protein NVSMB21_15840 [Vulcanimicrobiaceae bacterium]
MSRVVDEQRIAATISVDVDTRDGRYTFASASRQVTARVFDAAPYVVITGVKEIATSNGTAMSASGDSGGYLDRRIGQQIKQSPDPKLPSLMADTRIVTTVTCDNSRNISQSDPRSGSTSPLIEANRQGDMDWHYETVCVPTYQTPEPIKAPGYVPPVGDIYATVEEANRSLWSRMQGTSESFPK